MTNIAVLGTGMVGQAIAGRVNDLGHSVVVGTRDPEATLARTEPDQMGNAPFSAWLGAHAGVELATFADAAARADLVVNASSGAATLDVLRLAGADNLAGKVLLDIANPLDFSAGFPPPCPSRTPTPWASRSSAPSRRPRWSRASTPSPPR